MKKILFLLLCGMLISISTFASTERPSDKVATFVVKQTIEFSDSDDTLVIYYVKENGVYKVYSESDLTKQNPKRISAIESSNFKRTSSYKGTCYVTCNSLKEAVDLGYTLYKKYNKYIPELSEQYTPTNNTL